MINYHLSVLFYDTLPQFVFVFSDPPKQMFPLCYQAQKPRTVMIGLPVQTDFHFTQKRLLCLLSDVYVLSNYILQQLLFLKNRMAQCSFVFNEALDFMYVLAVHLLTLITLSLLSTLLLSLPRVNPDTLQESKFIPVPTSGCLRDGRGSTMVSLVRTLFMP